MVYNIYEERKISSVIIQYHDATLWPEIRQAFKALPEQCCHLQRRHNDDHVKRKTGSPPVLKKSDDGGE